MFTGLRRFLSWSRWLSNAATHFSLALKAIYICAERWVKHIRSLQYRELLQDLTAYASHCLKQILKPFVFSFSCWRSGAIVCTMLTTVVLVLNLSFATWAMLKRGVEDGIFVIYEGKCASVSARMNYIQIFVTMLSGLLLGASSYCMQILSAPTRAQIDAAHAKEMWLDIGRNSIRNVCSMSRRKKILWMFLGGSAVPLHSLSVVSVYAKDIAD